MIITITRTIEEMQTKIEIDTDHKDLSVLEIAQLIIELKESI